MNTVQPIRSREKIQQIKNILREQSERNYIMFILGINTGLRISDILKLKVADIHNKTHITITEQKTNKTKRFLINKQLKKDIDNFIKNKGDKEYLFQSQKGKNKPLTRIQAYRILNNAAVKAGEAEIGTHTLRKTFGYFHYKKYKDVAILQDIFNHSAPSITLRYIGITDDIKDKTIEDFYL